VSVELQFIIPEVGLLALAGVVIALDMFLRSTARRALGWVTAAGLAVLLGLAVWRVLQPSGGEIFGGMLRADTLAGSFRVIVLAAAMLSVLIAMGVEGLADRGEAYALMLVATLGMSLMAAAGDLVMLYLAIETTSIPLYLLAGYLKRESRSTEAGLKYFLFGAAASTVMLYGFSLLYGFTGETRLAAVAQSIGSGAMPTLLWIAAAVLVLVGFGFKISAVPLHFWTPDVYEGAPTPITAFISTASKAAGFAVLMRVMLTVFTPAVAPYWVGMVVAMSVATMTLGNVLALAQKNIKRLLAYSSIAHAGYALIGVVALSPLGIASTLFYLGAYVITNLAAFAVVIVVSRVVGSDDIAQFAGLSRRAPMLALAMLISFLSLAGMPPFVGFVAKVFVFAAAVQRGYVWLAVLGVLNSIVGLYYYLIVLKVVYLYRSENEAQPLPVTAPYKWALGLTLLGIVVLGVLSGPWFDWAIGAAGSLF
jgi:NADH-quinone oxidoreductase subunit N